MSELYKTWTLYSADPVCRALEMHATCAEQCWVGNKLNSTSLNTVKTITQIKFNWWNSFRLTTQYCSLLWFASCHLCSVSAQTTEQTRFQSFLSQLERWHFTFGQQSWATVSACVHKERTERYWHFFFWSKMFIVLQWLSQQIFHNCGSMERPKAMFCETVHEEV